MAEMQNVPGEDRGRVMLYALSTCGWCARTKELLTDLGVGFSYVYVDLLAGRSATAWSGRSNTGTRGSRFRRSSSVMQR